MGGGPRREELAMGNGIVVRFLKSLKTDNFPAVERIMNESLLTLMSTFSWFVSVVRGTALQD